MLAILTPGILLRFRPPVGKPVRYLVVARTVQSATGQVDVPSVARTTVILTPTGQTSVGTTVRLAYGRTRTAQSRKGFLEGEPRAATATIDPYGKPRAPLAANAASLTQMGGLQGVAFPPQPVRVGELWTVDLDAAARFLSRPQKGTTGRIPIRYTLSRVGKEGATIHVDLDGSARLTTAGKPTTVVLKGKGTIRLDPRTGLVSVSRLFLNTVAIFGGRSIGQRVDVTIARS